MTSYVDFLKTKAVADPPSGLAAAPDMPDALYPFQRDIVLWALRRGRAAIFADCGMGKTLMQLVWAHHIPGRTLILAPLAVTGQTVREGARFGLPATYARSGAESDARVVVTNYEMLGAFDVSQFAAVVLDESSILKSYMGKTKQNLLRTFAGFRFRLACTATPAPNDHLELGNHSQFLGVMDSNEMIARWFINDSMHAGDYRLKSHGASDFWRWVSSWAVSVTKPSDVGPYESSDAMFSLPTLSTRLQSVVAPPPEGELFHTGATLSATQIHRAKRASAKDRATAAATFANASGDQCLIWCDANYEADELSALVPDAADVRGSDKPDAKERALTDFAEGRVRVLITKPTIAGFGMNFQNCHRVAFVGLSYSFEQLYQALRRVWRYGQAHPVEALIVESEDESGIRSTVERKMAAHEALRTAMSESMRDFQRPDSHKALADLPPIVMESGHGFTLYNADCVEACARIETGTVDYSIFSPPFANLYIYSDSIADMGNCANYDEFFAQLAFLIHELFRVTVNGRLCSVHCKDLPAYKGRDGAAGLVDFPGRLIAAFEAGGWQYHSRVTIWKDPVIEMQRTKNHGLLHKQLCKDSSASRQGMADYLLTFRKWGGEGFPRPVRGPSPEVRFDSGYVGTDGPDRPDSPRDYSIQTWQRYASPVWDDINQTDVLQGSRGATTEDDERHICPLQLGVIRRALHLWTNPDDLVLSPFAGIGSEGVVALGMGRRFVGVELKASYWRQALRNLRDAHDNRNHDLFASEASA